jgi:hypothetical protein
VSFFFTRWGGISARPNRSPPSFHLAAPGAAC